MQAELCIHPANARHTEFEIADGQSLISIKVPANQALKVADAIKGVLDLAEHKVRRVNS